MEALLNKAYKDLFPEEDEQTLALRIQAELDAYEVSSPLNRTSQSFKKQETSFLEKEAEELSVWQEINSFKQENDKMFAKFQKNLDNFKEISAKFSKNQEKPQENLEILKEIGEFIEKDASFSDFREKTEENLQVPGESLLLSQLFSKNATKFQENRHEILEDAEIASLNQELEWLCMEKEDYLSQKLEENCIKSQFSLLSFEIPLKFPQNLVNPAFLPYNFKEKLLFLQTSSKIQELKPLIPAETTLLSRNSKEICEIELKKLRNPHKPLIFSQKPAKLKEPAAKLEETLDPKKPAEILRICARNLSFSREFLKKFFENLLNSFESALLSSKFRDFPPILSKKLAEILRFPSHIPHFSPVISAKSFTFSQLLEEIPQNLEFLQGLECRFEGLKDLVFSQKLSNLLSLRVSMNEISGFPAQLPSKLVFLDLSQNKIADYSALKPLKSLRFLNLELNFIEKMQLLDSEALETLNLNKNRVRKLENLSRKPNLCVLSLYQNEIDTISAEIWLPSLEFLDLGRNKLREIPQFCEQNAPCLRKLVLYNNEIESFPRNFSHFLLTELFLNNNRLLKFSESCAFLPSLELLNLENNRISLRNQEVSQCFCGNLKELNVAYNEIADFRAFCQTFRNSCALRAVDFRENPFFKGVSAETEEFLQLSASKIFCHLQKINGKTAKSQENRRFSKKNSDILQKRGFLVQRQELKLVRTLENEKFKQSLFKFSRIFLEKRAFLPHFHLKMLTTSAEIQQNNAFFFEKREFEAKIRRLARFFSRVLREKRAFREKIAKNLPKLAKIQRKVRAFLKKKRENSQKNDVFAVKIQKTFKGFLLRKKKKALFQEIAYKDPEIEDLQEVSLDFFAKKCEFDDFSLKIPDFLGEESQKVSISQRKFENPPKKLENSKKKLPPIENSQKISKILEDCEENSKNSEIFLESLSNSSTKRVFLQKLPRNEAKADQIMAAWGLNKPEIKGTLAIKLEKERKRLEKKSKKTLSAEERYAKFLRANQK